jgi:chromosome partitioning protein
MQLLLAYVMQYSRSMTKILSVVNLKGGSGKTTTTAHIAHAYAKRGERVLIVDADPQASLLNWADRAGWDIPVIGKAAPKLHLQLAGIIGDMFDVVVIDTPPLDEKAGIVYGALRVADTVLVPMAPTLMEHERLVDVWDAIDEAGAYRDDPIQAAALLNRVVPNAASTDIIREVVSGSGHRVLTTTIPRREAIAQAYGQPITQLFGHDQVIIELEREEIK